MKRWISHPERYPHRCPWSHQDAPADGPYLDTGLIYFAAREIDNRVEPDRRESALVISPQALREASLLPGSPVDVLWKGDAEALSADYTKLAEENEGLKQDCERLEEALADAYSKLAEAADPEKITEALVKRLDARYAKKPGPKTQAAA